MIPNLGNNLVFQGRDSDGNEIWRDRQTGQLYQSRPGGRPQPLNGLSNQYSYPPASRAPVERVPAEVRWATMSDMTNAGRMPNMDTMPPTQSGWFWSDDHNAYVNSQTGEAYGRYNTGEEWYAPPGSVPTGGMGGQIGPAPIVGAGMAPFAQGLQSAWNVANDPNQITTSGGYGQEFPSLATRLSNRWGAYQQAVGPGMATPNQVGAPVAAPAPRGYSEFGPGLTGVTGANGPTGQTVPRINYGPHEPPGFVLPEGVSNPTSAAQAKGTASKQAATNPVAYDAASGTLPLPTIKTASEQAINSASNWWAKNKGTFPVIGGNIPPPASKTAPNSGGGGNKTVPTPNGGGAGSKDATWILMAKKLGLDLDTIQNVYTKDPRWGNNEERAVRLMLSDKLWGDAARRAGVLTGNKDIDDRLWKEHYDSMTFGGRDPLEGHPAAQQAMDSASEEASNALGVDVREQMARDLAEYRKNNP